MAQQINSGSAPIVWSTVDDAFRIINQNFVELESLIGGPGVDFSSLSTNVGPSVTGNWDLGSDLLRWRDLYLTSSIQIGDASITATGGVLQIPSGSTIGGLLLDESYFKTIAVSGQDSIVADTGTDTLTVASGSGITLTTNQSTDTLTITNSGVTGATAGSGIGVSSSAGNVTFTNTGVTSLTAGSGISVSASVGGITIANSGIISVVTDPGSGISLDTSVPNVVRITNSSPATSISAFRTIAISGQDSIQADSSADTLTLVAGTGITLTTNESTDTITINSSAGSPSSLEQGVYSVSLDITGNLTFPGDITQSYQDYTICNAGVDTVVYTSTGQYQHAIKLFVMVEGFTDGGGGSWDTQACDIIAVKGYNDNIIHVTVYGVTYSGSAAIATFDGQWNATSNRIEITCSPVSVTNDVTVSVHAIEIRSND